MEPLVLASRSPQRKALMEGLNLPFEIVPSSVNEEAHVSEDPAKRAQQLARMKAQDVAAKMPGRVVIGCDTLVESSTGVLLEKPKDAADAAEMLREQSGSTSRIHSALCIVDAKGNLHEGLSTSKVWFKELTEEDIAWWISTNQWQDRSGSFQIDGQGQLMIEHLEGDWSGVVGLPVFLLGELLTEAGMP